MKIAFTRKSSNSKTGPIPVTTSPRSTCPTTCPLIGSCYPEAGFYTRLHWDKVDSGERGISWVEFGKKIASLPDGQLWRHNVAGDLPHTDGVIDYGMAHQMAFFSSTTNGFTYTHHLPEKGTNAETISMLNDSPGFTVNLSADSLEQADQYADLEIGPVVCIVEADRVENTVTPAGRKVVICPAAVRDDVTCATCKLCAITNRKAVIGFPAHGTNKARVESILDIKMA